MSFVNVSGGIKVITVEFIEGIIAKYFVTRPGDALIPLLADRVIRAAGRQVDSASECSDNQYSVGLDAILKKLITEVESFKDTATVLGTLENLFKQPIKDRREAVYTMSGYKQLNKLTVIPQFEAAFSVGRTDTSDPVQYLMDLGLTEDQATDEVEGSIRDVFVETYLLCAWASVQGLAERDPSWTREPGLLVGAVPTVDPPVAKRPVRVAATRAEEGKAKPNSEPRLPPTAEQFAALEASVAHLTALLVKVIPQVAQPPPVPLQTTTTTTQLPPVQRGMGRGQPAQTEPAAHDEDEDDIEQFDDEEDDCYSAKDLEGYKKAAKQRNILLDGQFNMQGELDVVTKSNASASAVPTHPAEPLHGVLLSNALHRCKANFALDAGELSMVHMLSMAASSDGFLVLSVCGVMYTHNPVFNTRSVVMVPKLITALYNPDNHPLLSRLGIPERSPFLFPVSPDHFEALISSELLKALPNSPLFAPDSSTKIINALLIYRGKCFRLLDNIFGGHSNAKVQEHHQHVTIWSVFLVFHLNRWMRALVNGDISLLLTGFDQTWQSTYAVQLGNGPDGLPLVSLEDAVQLLVYRCVQCRRAGACSLWCPNDSCRASPVKATSSGLDGPPGYMKAFKAWAKDQPEKASATEEAFSKTALFKQKGFSLPQTRAPVHSSAKSAGATGLQAKANSQQLIQIHACPIYDRA